MRARKQHRRRKVLTARTGRCREAGRGTISGASVPTKTWLSESRRRLQSEVPSRTSIPRATRGDAWRSAAARWFREQQFRAPSYVRDFRGVGDRAIKRTRLDRCPVSAAPVRGRSRQGRVAAAPTHAAWKTAGEGLWRRRAEAEPDDDVLRGKALDARRNTADASLFVFLPAPEDLRCAAHCAMHRKHRPHCAKERWRAAQEEHRGVAVTGAALIRMFTLAQQQQPRRALSLLVSPC